MTKYRVELNRAKCQAYGNCAAVAPGTFELDESRKVRLRGGEAADDAVVKAARGCPYRVITVLDAASGEPVFPIRRR